MGVELIALKSLNMSSNQIVSIAPIEAVRELREIDLGSNLITVIDALGGYRQLVVLGTLITVLGQDVVIADACTTPQR